MFLSFCYPLCCYNSSCSLFNISLLDLEIIITLSLSFWLFVQWWISSKAIDDTHKYTLRNSCYDSRSLVVPGAHLPCPGLLGLPSWGTVVQVAGRTKELRSHLGFNSSWPDVPSLWNTKQTSPPPRVELQEAGLIFQVLQQRMNVGSQDSPIEMKTLKNPYIPKLWMSSSQQWQLIFCVRRKQRGRLALSNIDHI